MGCFCSKEKQEEEEEQIGQTAIVLQPPPQNQQQQQVVPIINQEGIPMCMNCKANIGQIFLGCEHQFCNDCLYTKILADAGSNIQYIYDAKVKCFHCDYSIPVATCFNILGGEEQVQVYFNTEDNFNSNQNQISGQVHEQIQNLPPKLKQNISYGVTNQFSANQKRIIIFQQERYIDQKEQIECLICSYSYDSIKMCHLYCIHSYCDNCLYEFVKGQIVQAKVTNEYMKCPMANCEKQIHPNQIEFCLQINNDFEILDKYQKFCVKAANIQDNERIITCIFCQQMFIIFGPQEGATCYSCEKSFCPNCLKEPHWGEACQTKEEDEKRIKEMLEQKILRNCPKCNVVFEKDKGCEHMTCSQCQYQWCNICWKEWLEECKCEFNPYEFKRRNPTWNPDA